MTPFTSGYSAGSQPPAGFTLIELLVTITIGVILLGLGIVGFTDFNERQKIINSAKELETVFQTAQVKTQAGDLGDCTELSEYQVSFDTTVDPIVVSLTPLCADGTTGTAKTYTLGSGITLTLTPSVSIIHFSASQQGVFFTPTTTDLVFTLNSPTVSSGYVFALGRGGDISDGNWQ